MGYFRELPELDYQSFLSNRISNDEYIRVKNLFRRNKLREDLHSVFTLFDKYEIVEGARPDTVAEELYGSAELDWVVLLTGEITNPRDQWPLSNRELYNYTIKKYGETGLTSIHHYETREIKDSLGRLIMPAGMVVDEDFSISYRDELDISRDLQGYVSKSGSILVSGITNYEYESELNNKKSSIYLLKPGYIQQFLNDMRVNMLYGNSSEYVSERLIRTENTKQINQ